MMKRTPFFMAILSFLLVLSRTQADRSDTTTLLIKSQISKNQARLHPLSRISHSKLKLKRVFTMRSGDVVGVQVRAGLTSDECSSDQDCVGSRECIYLEDDEIFPCSNKSEHGKNSSSWCFCFGEEHFQICDYSHECVEGELCASIGGERPFCVSKDYVAENPGVVQTDGLTWDDCEAPSQCIPPHICRIKLDDDEFKECNYNPDELCHCFAERTAECETNADCPDRGEICAERTDKELESFYCISEDSVQRPSFWRPAPTPTSVISSPLPILDVTLPPPSDCIDVRALSHLSEEDLVFKTHFVAPVLCDSNDSCATPAHVVMHDGRPMMMRSYCATVGCTKKNMYVNSPKYYRRLVVKSKTPGLHFTVFAARYGTRLEEVVISSVLRLGF
ncbi:unnamed protein product [Chondrus crispus]|uniref:Uncharacterized protein n=1 Tax=Chondrus crispus TaxID=2769 RepID=R7Q3N9_CHOCR|nr:unnamed protein product [Chondrus crispus]CDF33147.1 unnamed protein product [Chondrus crispus]|eukprot:XP_005712950.1 unnamed protein product [Chondrus crispus]